MEKIPFLLFLLVLGTTKGQQIDSPREIGMEIFIEKVGNYAQFVPTAFSLITVLANKYKKGFWQLSKSASANLDPL